MVDLHSHVLPGIDDGPADLEGSLRMARAAADEGTRVLAATPHVRGDHPRVIPREVPRRVADLNAALRAEGIDVRVVPGGEVALLDALERDADELRHVTLGGNGRDLLVETPFGDVGVAFERTLAGVRSRGFRVLLAHPEMSRGFQAEPARLGRLVETGVMMQVTAASLAADRGDPAGRLALHALRQGWVHVVASDGHRADWRPPVLRDGLDAARAAMPEADEELDWLVEDAPTAILRGEELPPRPARESRKRWWRGPR